MNVLYYNQNLNNYLFKILEKKIWYKVWNDGRISVDLMIWVFQILFKLINQIIMNFNFL